MHRRNFGFISGIIVDVCALHGNWFDVGELARILAFVGQGGLERGQTAKLELARARCGPAENANGLAPASVGASSMDDSLIWDDLREAGVAFARWVQEAFRR